MYKFNEVQIPTNIKTIYVRYIDNRARYINPLLSPQLTEKLKQKIISQTKLTQTNNENADYLLTGQITNYDVSTSGISSQQAATNRLTVGVSLVLRDNVNTTIPEKNITVSRSFDFSASLTLPQAEANLNTEIIRNLTDEIFNHIFSDW